MTIFDLEALVEKKTGIFIRKGYLKGNLRFGRSIRLNGVRQAIRDILDIPATPTE